MTEKLYTIDIECSKRIYDGGTEWKWWVWLKDKDGVSIYNQHSDHDYFGIKYGYHGGLAILDGRYEAKKLHEMLIRMGVPKKAIARVERTTTKDLRS